jgi:hypothetical protein
MAQLGYESWLGVAKEAAWGTPLTATNFLEFNSESLEKTGEANVLEALGSTGRNPSKRWIGNHNAGGAVEVALNIMEPAVCLMIANAIGGSVTSTDVSGAKNHVIAQGAFASGVTSLTLTKRVGSATDTYQLAGCRVNSMTIKGEKNSPIIGTFEMVAKDCTVATDALTVNLNDSDPLDFTGVNIEQVETTTSLDGSTGTQTILAFEVNYSNNLISDDTARALGSRNLDILPAGMAGATIKLTKRYDTSTAYSTAFAETKQALRISMDTGVTVGTGTTASMMITFPNCYLDPQGVVPGLDNSGIVTQEETWVALSPTTTDAFIQVELNNDTATL